MNGAIEAAEADERRRLIRVKEAFHKRVDDGLDKNRFHGDEETVALLKQARRLAAEHFRRFSDEAVAKIVRGVREGRQQGVELADAILGKGRSSTTRAPRA